MTLQPATIDKLGKLFPRLASNHDGEVVATARAIMRTLESAGSSLHDLGSAMKPKTVQKIVYREKTVYRDRPVPPPPEPQPEPEYIDMPHKSTVALADILLNECNISAKEEEFIRHMRKAAVQRQNKFRMTAKQKHWWDSILSDYRVTEDE